MTILNIHIKEDEKKKIQNYVNSKEIKSVSKFVRSLIAEKLEMERQIQDYEDDIVIPDYIPKNKFVAIVKGSIVAVGDTPSEVCEIAITKFPKLPISIKFTGPNKFKPPEFIYMSLSKLNCWKYIKLEQLIYPLIPVTIKLENDEKKFEALIDTAASLCLLKNGLFPEEKFKLSREEVIYTAAGIIKTKIYSGTFKILDATFEIEFIFSPISDLLPFKFIIGQNLLKELDAYFFGKQKTVCIKKAV
ncbi:MAG: DUF5678 domain-containing protein [Candidatus Helarchaeota archaeon]